MKKYADSIGVDISKSFFDAVIYHGDIHDQFRNDKKGFEKFRKWILRHHSNLSEVLVCFEHTGFYSLNLAVYLNDQKIDYCQVHALDLKRSIGFKRGKIDKADARDIALYAWQNRDRIKLTEPTTQSIVKLQQLKATRELFVRQSVAIKNQIKSFVVVGDAAISDVSKKSLKVVLRSLGRQVSKIEHEIDALISTDKQLHQNYMLCKSVIGVGLVLALEMIIHTRNFTCFNSWRKFAAYCGTVLYPYQSGTSINRRSRIHPISDRQMKSLLTMSSILALRVDPELKGYYKRRVEEGKPKMSVINMIRNKMLARIFATVKRGTPYVVLAKHAA